MRTATLARLFVVTLAVLASATAPARAADQSKPPAHAQRSMRSDSMCGAHMMTPQERATHRERMHQAATQDERDRIQREHHEAMRARAKERGVDLREREGCMMQGMMGQGMGRKMMPGAQGAASAPG
jgi:hypothetical protein